MQAEDFQKLLDERLELERDEWIPDEVICFAIPQVAKLLDVSRHTVYRLVKSGDMGSILVKSMVRIPLSEIKKFMRRNWRQT